MDKRKWAIAWLVLIVMTIAGTVEYHIWSGLGVTGGLLIHGIGAVLILTLWAFSVLTENSKSHDGGW